MNKRQNTGLIILINIILIIIICLTIIFLIRFTYINFKIPRSALAILILLSCPLVWGTTIYLTIKKKTPGHLIVNKIIKRK